MDGWKKVIWSHETRATEGRCANVIFTRKPGEELDNTYSINNYRKQNGRMFLGNFAASEK